MLFGKFSKTLESLVSNDCARQDYAGKPTAEHENNRPYERRPTHNLYVRLSNFFTGRKVGFSERGFLN